MLHVTVVIEGGVCQGVYVVDEHDQPVEFTLEIDDRDEPGEDEDEDDDAAV